MLHKGNTDPRGHICLAVFDRSLTWPKPWKIRHITGWQCVSVTHIDTTDKFTRRQNCARRIVGNYNVRSIVINDTSPDGDVRGNFICIREDDVGKHVAICSPGYALAITAAANNTRPFGNTSNVILRKVEVLCMLQIRQGQTHCMASVPELFDQPFKPGHMPKSAAKFPCKKYSSQFDT